MRDHISYDALRSRLLQGEGNESLSVKQGSLRRHLFPHFLYAFAVSRTLQIHLPISSLCKQINVTEMGKDESHSNLPRSPTPSLLST
ncbi:26S Proteasome Non-Atpase Regulatory Subunit 3 [Manis pentadactyla]|nr:26S Proteasome Non-Atpase Regulatory Subunit 3 [Manis pentadactyla]